MSPSDGFTSSELVAPGLGTATRRSDLLSIQRFLDGGENAVDKAIDAAQTLMHEALAEIEKRNKAGEPASSAAVVKVLKAIVQSLG